MGRLRDIGNMNEHLYVSGMQNTLVFLIWNIMKEIFHFKKSLQSWDDGGNKNIVI